MEDVNGNLVWKLTVLPTTPNGGRVLAVPPVCGPKVASKRRRSARQDQVPQSTWQEDPRDLAELAGNLRATHGRHCEHTTSVRCSGQHCEFPHKVPVHILLPCSLEVRECALREGTIFVLL